MMSAAKPGTSIGALAGALVTAPLIAVFYLGRRAGGLPFVPFDLFDWLARRFRVDDGDWPFEGGNHTLTVRCSDGTRTPQIAIRSEPHPSGATGLYRRGATL